MNDSERADFEVTIEDCFAMYEAEPKDLNVWWSACRRFELKAVMAALVFHMEDEQAKYPPRPADIVRIVANNRPPDGHVPPAEAWAIAVEAMDEDNTVVWTPEIAEAWGVSKLLMDAGDRDGARMAFRSAYEGHLAQSRADGIRPKWFPSLGHDPNKRAAALQAAADRLRLPHFAEQAAIEDKSQQPSSSQEVNAWIAEARRKMTFQASRPQAEIPLDEIVAALPEDREARRKALAQMTPSLERRARQLLLEAEKKRQGEAFRRLWSELEPD
jgi:hypothetical protein